MLGTKYPLQQASKCTLHLLFRPLSGSLHRDIDYFSEPDLNG